MTPNWVMSARFSPGGLVSPVGSVPDSVVGFAAAVWAEPETEGAAAARPRLEVAARCARGRAAAAFDRGPHVSLWRRYGSRGPVARLRQRALRLSRGSGAGSRNPAGVVPEVGRPHGVVEGAVEPVEQHLARAPVAVDEGVHDLVPVEPLPRVER